MHAIQQLMPCLSLFVIILSTPCRGEDLTGEQLARVHLKRVHLYSGWEFEYKSSLVTADGEPLELQNILVLDATDEPVHRLWIAYREKNDESDRDDALLVHRFAGWNGEEYREYERKCPPGFPKDAVWNSGSISATERFASYFYKQNRFDAILTSGPHGIPQYVDVSGKIFDKHPFRFRVVGRGERLGVPTLQLEAKEGNEMLAEAELSDTPEHLVLRQVIYNDSQPVLKCAVTSLERLDGTLYPKSGRLEREKVGGIQSLEYRFTVDNVSKTKRTVDEWFPQWPLGTVVKDNIGAKQIVIPKGFE